MARKPNNKTRASLEAFLMAETGPYRVWKVCTGSGTLVAFVEKWKPEPGYTHPFKVMSPIVGQGIPRYGDMVKADYESRDPVAAVKAAISENLLRL